jgi:hypothetical protein
MYCKRNLTGDDRTSSEVNTRNGLQCDTVISANSKAIFHELGHSKTQRYARRTRGSPSIIILQILQRFAIKGKCEMCALISCGGGWSAMS